MEGNSGVQGVEEQPEGQEPARGNTVPFSRPPRRIYKEPNYNEVGMLDSVLSQVGKDVLSD